MGSVEGLAEVPASSCSPGESMAFELASAFVSMLSGSWLSQLLWSLQ